MSGFTLELGSSPAFLGRFLLFLAKVLTLISVALTATASSLWTICSVRSRGLPCLALEWWFEPVLELEPLRQSILHVGSCTAQVHADLSKCAVT